MQEDPLDEGTFSVPAWREDPGDPGAFIAKSLTPELSLEGGASSFFVVEDATPVVGGSFAGGIPQATLVIPERARSKLYGGKQVELRDKLLGRMIGRSAAPSGNGLEVTLIVDGRTAALTVERTAQPYSGNLGGALLYYLGLCGIDSGVIIEGGVFDRPVAYLGWEGVVLDWIKEICVAQQIDMAEVGANIVFRGLRQRVAANHRNTEITWSFDETSLAQSVIVNWYDNTPRASAMVYPLDGWSEDVPKWTVDPGETLEFDIPLWPDGDEEGAGFSLTSIEQPVCLEFVPRDYSGPSAYCVAGDDGLPIMPEQWNAGGGKVEVEIGEDTRSVIIRVTGATGTSSESFTIAASAGPSDTYGSIRLRGSGIQTYRHRLTYYTGLSTDAAPTAVGITVDNEAITTYQQAFDVAAWTLGQYADARPSINVQTVGINRLGDSGEYSYATFGDFNEAYAGMTAGDFNDHWGPGLTAAEFNDYWTTQTASDFTNQAFGNIAGARVENDGLWFRIDNARIAPLVTSYTASGNTTMGDFNAHYDGMTAAEFNALFAGMVASEFNVRPLVAT